MATTQPDFKTVDIAVTIEGLSPIMFDKFRDHSSPELPMDQKIYLERGTNALVLPAANIMSFLVGENPAGIIKVDKGKKFAEFTRIVKSHLSLSAPMFPFMDGQGQKIIFDNFDNPERWGVCEEGGLTKASNGKIIKQEAKQRPYLRLPWELSFTIILAITEFNKIVTSELLQDWFIKGGILVALGTYRPLYGRFSVKNWEMRAAK